MHRINETLLSRPERRLVDSLCRLVPAQVQPDHLTALGLLGAMLVMAGFALSSQSHGFLWLAFAGLVINWVGDSMDGSLARFRNRARPRYGYFLDHMVDSFSMAFIGIGAGLSPSLSMASCLLVLVAYLMLMVMSVLEARVRDVMRISFGRIGPTEFRLFLLAIIAMMFMEPDASLSLFEQRIGTYDAVLAATGLIMLAMCLAAAIRIAADLARDDPPRP